MKIAYFSPLNPIKSGISDFAEELLPFLARNSEIELFVDHFVPSSVDICRDFVVHDIREYDNPELRETFDTAVFQVGNNYEFHRAIVEAFTNYGGILELHDLSLHHFIAAEMICQGKIDEYKNLINYCHGRKGLAEAEDYLNGKTDSLWETRPLEFPVNKHLIDLADAVIVHSDFARQMVLSINSTIPVAVIPLGTVDIVDDPEAHKSHCRACLHIAGDRIVFGSFGLATPTKRIIETISALEKYKCTINSNFTYYIVGSVSGIDIEKEISARGLKDNVVVTGFLELDMFKLYMGACDICINLRYPTQGESSAVLHRLMGLGKPVIVTDIGSFAEYPYQVAYKIPYGKEEVPELLHALTVWTSKAGMMEKRAIGAKEYAAENLSMDIVGKEYESFFEKVAGGMIEPDLENIYISRLIRAAKGSAETIDTFMQQNHASILRLCREEAAQKKNKALPEYLDKKADQLAEMDFTVGYFDHFADMCSIFAVNSEL